MISAIISKTLLAPLVLREPSGEKSIKIYLSESEYTKGLDRGDILPVFESAIDPNHQVVGKEPPSSDNPWFFNLCRQRIRDNQPELSAYSPTMGRGFHVLEKFARMVGTEEK